MIESMRKKLHVTFSGQVQGIGFRASVQSWASGLGLAGWVRNNPDGTVELEIEGEELKLQELLQKISQSHLQSFITNTEIEWKTVEKDERSDLSYGVVDVF